jgi:hypothetical protein
VRTLARELRQQGHAVSHQLVAELLRGLDYSLQGNRKTREGANHADRDAQFAHINRRCAEFLAAGEPVISVDTQKRELVGDFYLRYFLAVGRVVSAPEFATQDAHLAAGWGFYWYGLFLVWGGSLAAAAWWSRRTRSGTPRGTRDG